MVAICRNLISLARRTPLNGIIPFDKNITFHKRSSLKSCEIRLRTGADPCVADAVTAWSIVFFSLLHTFAHWNNFAQLAAKNNLGLVGFLKANFLTGPGWTGYIMLVALLAMVFTSLEKPRRANFERFWYPSSSCRDSFLKWLGKEKT